MPALLVTGGTWVLSSGADMEAEWTETAHNRPALSSDGLQRKICWRGGPAIFVPEQGQHVDFTDETFSHTPDP
jgi:hypothetical protein